MGAAPKHRTCASLLGFLLLVVGGCTTGHSRPEAPPPSVTVPPGTAPPPLGTAISAAARFPLDHYLLRPAQANDLDTVTKQLTGDCMTRHGLRWAPGERNEFDLLRHRAHRFGLADEGLAAAAGYHWDPTPSRPPAGGARACAGEASRALGWRAGEFDWLRQLGDDALRRAYADPRATAVLGRWSECMAEAGFRYGRPQDAETYARRRQRADAAEKRTAVADVRCKARVRLVEELSTVLVDMQQQAVRENGSRLETFRRMADSAAARADALRGDHRRPGRTSATPVPPGQWRTEHASA